MTRQRPPRAPARSRPGAERTAQQRIQEIAASLGSGEESVRRARLVLRSGSQTAIDQVIKRFQQLQADSRWGPGNPLSEILGPLRIASIKSLRGPPGADGARHDHALFVLCFAAKPRDIPLLTGLLERSRPALVSSVCGAIDHALESCTEPHPALIAALERVIAQTPASDEADHPARTLGWYHVPEAEEALERLRQQTGPRPRAGVLAALLHRSPARHLDEARQLVATLETLSPPPDEPWRPLVPYYLTEAIREAEEALAAGADVEARATEAPPAPGDDAAAWEAWLAGRDGREAAGALLTALAEAAVAQQARLLGLLGRVARNEEHRFFRVVWPLTRSTDDEVAVAAVRACALTTSEQAIQRLKTRLRKAREAGDERTARVVERGLREAEEPEDDGDEDDREGVV